MGRQSLPLKGQAPTARRATGCGGFRTSVLWRFTPLDCFEAGKNRRRLGADNPRSDDACPLGCLKSEPVMDAHPRNPGGVTRAHNRPKDGYARQ